jgi:transcriptional regulator with XRE-family HTH domain
MSQEELADEAGVTRQWLIRFEQGGSEVSLSKVFAVLAALDLVTLVEPRTGSDRAPAPRVSVEPLAGSADLREHWSDLARRLGTAGFAELRLSADEMRRAPGGEDET